ncbi:MAG: type I DNA topoisomerase [Patescibacteria group bacterium]
MKNLVIVESPTKGKKIESYLGKDFTVKASMGHIRDLEKKNLGIDIENGFKPTYIVSEEKKKTVNELKKLAKQAENVILATDPDREGEAIAWHLCQVLELDPAKAQRVVYHEITKDSIVKSFAKPGTIDIDLVNAQQSRRILDRLVGFKVSPVLWQKIKTGLSAGRVQSVAVKLIVEREREIKAFVPEESWRITTQAESAGIKFDIELTKLSGKAAKLKTRADLEKLLAALGADVSTLAFKEGKKGTLSTEIKLPLDFKLENAEKKESVRTPGAPFTTSTLQQEASRKLGYSLNQTMSVAQSLYQNGHITYMRTDSVNLSDLAIGAAKAFIEKQFGKEYSLPEGRKFKTKQANAQEAHEAIRPTDMDKTPDSIGLEASELRLYKLIWERTVASQMKEALVETTTYQFIPAQADNELWVSKGEVVKFPGFMKLYVEGNDDEEEADSKALPAISEGEIIKTQSLRGDQSFTRPPARYTEAALVKKLEADEIGRPATYAPTISTIVERGYVEKIEKKLAPTDIAFTVNDFLEANFPDMMDYKFTAKVEQEFDQVAQGNLEWVVMLERFYGKFSQDLEKVMESKGKVQEKVGRNCPKCEEGELVYKFSKAGRFIGCNRYPECDFIENIVKPGENEYIEKLKAEFEGKECPAGGTIVVKNGRFGPFLASSLYPEVKWIGKVPDQKLAPLEEKYGGEVCDKCGVGTMHVKNSKRGPFLACSAYPECKNAKNLPKDAKNTEEGAPEPMGSNGIGGSDEPPLPPDTQGIEE